MTTSLINRLVSRPRPWWVTLIIGLVLILLLFGAALLDGALADLVRSWALRVYLVTPCAILYILIISPPMERIGQEVLRAFRPMVQLDDEQFDHLVLENSQISPIKELVAFGIGALLAPWLVGAPDNESTWLWVYRLVTSILMYGLLTWAIFSSIVATRLTNVLHKQRLEFDLYNIFPFEVIGRQSLLLSLVFIGGISLSLLLTFQAQSFKEISSWVGNLPIALVAIAVFFLNMLPTHNLLAAKKSRELATIQGHLQHLAQKLLQQLENDQEALDLSSKINALAAYQQHIQDARTWPYNTSMLRTLFFSFLVPVATVLGKLLIEIAF